MSWGLYEDLAPPSKDLTIATSSSGTSTPSQTTNSSLLGANPISKVPPSLRPKKPLLTPRVAQTAKRLSSEPKKQLTKKPKLEVASNSSTLPTLSKEVIYNTHVSTNASDPYDPAKPNDYEEYLEEKKKAATAPPVSLTSESEKQDPKYEPPRPSVAIPPPPVYHTATDEDDKTKPKDDDDDADGIPLSALPSGPFNKFNFPTESNKPSSGLERAEKMMMNMGWKGSGHGLGSKGQGIPNPITVIKTQAGTGIITVDKGVKPIESSTVIVLRNMSVKGQVDDMLQPETASECQKYGKVLDCVVYEVPGDVPPEESVRIFVRFERVDEALRAKRDLDGRYFDGRVVRASFYDEQKFLNKDYRAPIV